jgi:hypothetical protein
MTANQKSRIKRRIDAIIRLAVNAMYVELTTGKF